jgi:hypothetical protein
MACIVVTPKCSIIPETIKMTGLIAFSVRSGTARIATKLVSDSVVYVPYVMRV